MQIAVAHNNTDFDSLAAQFAVTKLYPGTKMVPSNSLSPNIKEYLTLYRNQLPIVDLQYVDVHKIKHVFIVDCHHIDRLDEVVRKLIDNKQVTHTVFDHHQPQDDALIRSARDDSAVEPVGSCTSLLVSRMIEKGIDVVPFEATLLLIGIYEDTGCMTFPGTTAMDAQCVAYLLARGADLNQVNNFINPKLGENQTELFQEVISNARPVTISGAKVMLSHASTDRYIEGLATLTRRLMEVSSADAALTAVFMRDRTHVVGRSDNPSIDVRAVVRELGGDGHKGAASAVVKDADPERLLDRIIDLLERGSGPEPAAGEIMTKPVRTIKPDVAMEEAGRIMLRYGQDGLVVMDEGAVLGIVSKRDVDKATHHKLSHAPVRGFMSTPAIMINQRASLSEIQSVMIENEIGRLPVVDDEGELVGIITRKELLSSLFGTGAVEENDFQLSIRDRRIDLRERLAGRLTPSTDWLFKTIGHHARVLGMVAYAVGGVVRDIYLSRPNFDLDFVIEGSAIELAHALEEAYPSRFELVAKHDRFKTATMIFRAEENREIDLSTARTEFYEFPAALPTVEAAALEHDLFRRDFTINALALSVNEDDFGYAIDFFDGVGDIEAKLVRILHAFSFIEDPTRIVRAVRFASRLGFHLEPKTRQQADRAIAMGVFDNLGGFRLKEELRLILESQHRLKALDLLNELGGGLRYLSSNLLYDDATRIIIRRAERLLMRNPIKKDWVVYLALLLSPLSNEEVENVMDRLVLANDEREWIRGGLLLVGNMQEQAQNKWMARSAIYDLLHGYSEQSLAIAASIAPAGAPARRWIKLYLDELRHVKPSMSGNDLMKLGFQQGPKIKEALQALHTARLDGEVETPAEEFEFIKKKFASRFR